MVSTLDSESSDPSSNLGGTCVLLLLVSRTIYSVNNRQNKYDAKQQKQSFSYQFPS